MKEIKKNDFNPDYNLDKIIDNVESQFEKKPTLKFCFVHPKYLNEINLSEYDRLKRSYENNGYHVHGIYKYNEYTYQRDEGPTGIRAMMISKIPITQWMVDALNSAKYN